MASKKQTAANRRNGRKGTGPRTKSGKTRSSRNALKHGLTAKQVVMLDEDPAAFEALREDLYVYFQPADPVAEHLVEQVAASIWRLRRVPEIEAGIFENFYYRRQGNRARSKEFELLDVDEERQAKARQDEPRPLLGKVFSDAERPLSSLTRIAGAIESSMHRAIRELERMKVERQDASIEDGVIDVEDDVERSQPRLIQS